jgi:hypothetical protein
MRERCGRRQRSLVLSNGPHGDQVERISEVGSLRDILEACGLDGRGQTNFAGSLAEECALAQSRFNHEQSSRAQSEGKGDGRRATSRTEVGNPDVMREISAGSHGLEQQAVDGLVRIGQAGQIDGAVPALQQIEVGNELAAEVFVEGQTFPARTFRETLAQIR